MLTGCVEYLAIQVGHKVIQEIHLEDHDFLNHEEISSALIYFYSRIGEVEKAQLLFDEILHENERSKTNISIITFNNMLSCYAYHRQGSKALKLYNEMMIDRKIAFSDQTFTILLKAYSNSGMVNEAVDLFENTIKPIYRNNISPIIVSAMIDVYAGSGRFEQAESLISDKMDFISWNSILSACRKFNNVEFGEKAFRNLMLINKKEASPYVLISNIYMNLGLYEKADNIRMLMGRNGVSKTPGIVYHEENETVYQFISGSSYYERFEQVERMSKEIYNKIKQAGFESDLRCVTSTKEMNNDQKMDSLNGHAEKIAIAHAFVMNPNRKSIILKVKNQRICNDCHLAMQTISKVMNVEITVRDSNCFHHFKDGKCSCNIQIFDHNFLFIFQRNCC